MAEQTPRPSQAGIKTDLRQNAIGLPGVLMQGVATIAPAFSILAAFVFTVSLAGIVTPWAYLIAGVILAAQALSTAQAAKLFPSAGGWYTWIARTLEPRSGFFAGWIFTIWLPPVGALTFSFLAQTVLEPTIKQYYGVTIYWWIFVILGLALVAWWAYAGIKISERLMIITGMVEIVLMVALAITALASPGPGGFNASSFSFANFSKAPDFFLAIVFTIFAYSGWEATGPIAEESRNPKKLIPMGLVGSVLILMIYEVFASWGYLVGVGTSKVGAIPTAAAWPVATLAHRVWAGAWLLLLFALLNSTIAVSISCFNGATRTWYAMGRSGVLPSWLSKVSPGRKTPDNAITLQLVVTALVFVLVIIFGAANVFFTWALTITLGLILMYILSNIGVMKYYLTEGRPQFNVLLHAILPVAVTVAVGFVGYKSVVPLPPPPVKWAPIVFVVYLAVGALILVYSRVRGRDEWLEKAGMAMAVPEEAESAMTGSEDKP